MSIGSCKLVLVGNGSVGKTSIIRRFQADGFEKVYNQTIGCDFFEKVLELKSGVAPLKVSVWDIGGQSLASKNLPNYLAGADAVFLCYDVTDPQSFADVEDWLKVVQVHVAATNTGVKPSKKASPPRPSLYLLGNKLDLLQHRQVSSLSHSSFVSSHSLSGGFLVAAANGDNVLTSFYVVAAECAGVKLSSHDLAFTAKVLAGVVPKEAPVGGGGKGEKRGKQEEEDAKAHDDIMRRIGGGGVRMRGGGCQGCRIT